MKLIYCGLQEQYLFEFAIFMKERHNIEQMFSEYKIDN